MPQNNKIKKLKEEEEKKKVPLFDCPYLHQAELAKEESPRGRLFRKIGVAQGIPRKDDAAFEEFRKTLLED